MLTDAGYTLFSQLWARSLEWRQSMYWSCFQRRMLRPGHKQTNTYKLFLIDSKVHLDRLKHERVTVWKNFIFSTLQWNTFDLYSNSCCCCCCSCVVRSRCSQSTCSMAYMIFFCCSQVGDQLKARVSRENVSLATKSTGDAPLQSIKFDQAGEGFLLEQSKTKPSVRGRLWYWKQFTVASSGRQE